MTRMKLLRRVAKMCCICLCNLAFYRAGRRNNKIIIDRQFWRSANSNSLDISVLEWCKLFGDFKGKHYWGKVITDKDGFYDGLLNKLQMDEKQFSDYIDEMRAYRDKFLAHLDLEEVMQIPNMDITKKSTVYLYDYLLAHEDEGGFFEDGPDDATGYYAGMMEIGRNVYERNEGDHR